MAGGEHAEGPACFCHYGFHCGVHSLLIFVLFFIAFWAANLAESLCKLLGSMHDERLQAAAAVATQGV
jgi:hypothetical protein